MKTKPLTKVIEHPLSCICGEKERLTFMWNESGGHGESFHSDLRVICNSCGLGSSGYLGNCYSSPQEEHFISAYNTWQFLVQRLIGAPPSQSSPIQDQRSMNFIELLKNSK